jgi:hypothetical protein
VHFLTAVIHHYINSFSYIKNAHKTPFALDRHNRLSTTMIFDRPPFCAGHEQQPLSPVTPVGEDGSFPAVQIVDHDRGHLEARQKVWH